MADDSEKTEEPTPKRRREAREKGQVLKSKEVNTAALVLISAYSLSWFGKQIYINLFKLFTQTIQELPYVDLTVPITLKYGVRFLLITLFCVLPIMFAVYVTAALVELLQVGILFTTKTLKPDLNKINPIKGFKRVFSMKSLVELVKSFIKTLIIGWVAYTVIRDNIGHIIGLIREPPEASFVLVGELVLKIAKKVAGAMVIIASLDYFYQRYEFEKSLKMSKQEVKDEYKQTEGDPHIKAKQRQKQRQIARGQVRQAVPQSSAVVSNPTHYAIALRYDPQNDEAPVVTTKGEDTMALLIKELAIKHDIPIFEDRELARAMYPVCVIDKPIPPEFYTAVAQIILKLMKEKQQKQLLEMLNKQAKKRFKSKQVENRNEFNNNQSSNNQENKTGPSSIFD
ncbi:MAG: flagellar biosynthetic protein FlhB [Candidatus Sericytochromatia bacterium]|nr:MAG: flagellar biosynthetic protein FlhB [Candidatus Sericytochromatia bacterium]